jgi:hypothetical protein
MEIIIPNEIPGMSESGETHLLMEPYAFEMNALRKFYGLHYLDKIKRGLICNAYCKWRPGKLIDKMVVIGEEHGASEDEMMRVAYKWFMQNEHLFDLKFKARDGREGERYEDMKRGVDDRETVEYTSDYKDPWADEKVEKI